MNDSLLDKGGRDLYTRICELFPFVPEGSLKEPSLQQEEQES